MQRRYRAGSRRSCGTGDSCRPSGTHTWAASDALLREYYDTEWVMPVRDERGLFVRLALDSGLSWTTILRKRDSFRPAFSSFVPEAIADFDDEDATRLLADPRTIRNRAKILATIKNAAATIALRAEGGLSFSHGCISQRKRRYLGQWPRCQSCRTSRLRSARHSVEKDSH